jgi:hypothetical protein
MRDLMKLRQKLDEVLFKRETSDKRKMMMGKDKIVRAKTYKINQHTNKSKHM